MNTEVLPRQHWQYTMVVPQTIHSKEVNEMEQITTACECIQHCSSSDARRGEQIPTGIRSSSKPSVGNQLLGVATGWPRSEGVKRCEREALLDFHKQSAGADKEDYKSKNSLCTAPRL